MERSGSGSTGRLGSHCQTTTYVLLTNPLKERESKKKGLGPKGAVAKATNVGALSGKLAPPRRAAPPAAPAKGEGAYFDLRNKRAVAKQD
jgi:hypothetical protein